MYAALNQYIQRINMAGFIIKKLINARVVKA